MKVVRDDTRAAIILEWTFGKTPNQPYSGFVIVDGTRPVAAFIINEWNGGSLHLTATAKARSAFLPCSRNAPPPTSPRAGAGGMTREQAERLLGSLGDLERLERQNRRREQVQRERKGKDW